MNIRIHRTALVVTAVSALVGVPVVSWVGALLLTSIKLKRWNMPRKPSRRAKGSMPMP